MEDSLIEQLTQDGSSTFWNPAYQESYHSSIGAYTEALHKHVLATQIDKLAQTNNELKILDLCFGLGYNSMLAIQVAQEKNPKIFLDIIGLENDSRIIETINLIQTHEKIKEIHKEFKNLAKPYTIKTNSYQVQILLGDARETIKNLESDFFDAIFFDPFSPKVCPELWTLEFIKETISKLKPDRFISTYSSARIAKDNFLEAGCEILEGPKLNRRNGGVLGRKKYL